MAAFIIGTLIGAAAMSLLNAYLYRGWRRALDRSIARGDLLDKAHGRIAELLPLAKIGAARKASWQAHRARKSA